MLEQLSIVAHIVERFYVPPVTAQQQVEKLSPLIKRALQNLEHIPKAPDLSTSFLFQKSWHLRGDTQPHITLDQLFRDHSLPKARYQFPSHPSTNLDVRLFSFLLVPIQRPEKLI